MKMEKQTTMTRDVEAREIPSGMAVTLRAGDPVAITQSLGGSYTVITTSGFMARIDGKDADAIGEKVVEADAAAVRGQDRRRAVLGAAEDLLRPRDPGQRRRPGARLQVRALRPARGRKESRRALHADGARLRHGRHAEGRHEAQAARRAGRQGGRRAGALRPALEHGDDVGCCQAATGDAVRGKR